MDVSQFDSLSEGRSLAQIAADYIRTHGTSDSLFIAYFGATTSSTPLDNFMVCPGRRDSSAFLIAPQYSQW